MSHYEVDPYDRIVDALSDVEPGLLRRLDPAARLAARKLEHLRLITTRLVKRGSFIAVVADAERVATVHIFDHPDRRAVLEAAVRSFADEPGSDDRGFVPRCVDYFIQEFGGAVGEATPDAGIAAINVFAGLLSLHGSIIERFEKIAELAVCPVLVGLIGKGANPGTIAMASGLIALAPYAEAFL
jgi:hypothetical protein